MKKESGKEGRRGKPWMDERTGETNNVKSVMFCPYTRNSELAKSLRHEEEKLKELTGYRMKIVKQAGRKITELLQPMERRGLWA